MKNVQSDKKFEQLINGRGASKNEMTKIQTIERYREVQPKWNRDKRSM